MRISLKLKSNKTVEQSKEINSKYYSAMHGWIYNKLEGTPFSELYQKIGFKLFCFSNLYPVHEGTVKEGEVYNIIISSPNEIFIISLISKIDREEIINLGEYSFKLVSYKPLPPKSIPNFSEINSETPINICLPEEGEKDNLIKKSITLNSDEKGFKAQLKKNLIRKYNEYYKKNIKENFDLWENINIVQIKNTECAIKMNFTKRSDNWFDVIGARYIFKIGEINNTQREILQLCYDLGFGERNSFGFGFMNIKKHIKKD